MNTQHSVAAACVMALAATGTSAQEQHPKPQEEVIVTSTPEQARAFSVEEDDPWSSRVRLR